MWQKLIFVQMWVKYGPETSKGTAIFICLQCLWCGNVLGSFFGSNVWQINIWISMKHNIYFPESELTTRWVLVHPLSPWPPVESFTIRWILNHPLSCCKMLQTSRPGFDPYPSCVLNDMFCWLFKNSFQIGPAKVHKKLENPDVCPLGHSSS